MEQYVVGIMVTVDSKIVQISQETPTKYVKHYFKKEHVLLV